MFDDVLKRKSDGVLVVENSSWIDGFSYTEGILAMRTKSGNAYSYEVPEKIWKKIKSVISSGGSVGAFFNENIRGKYDDLYA